MIKKILPALTLLLVSITIKGQDQRVEVYIERYKEIAIEEMHRTGIPASIKLAQAILESRAGESELCIESNNHFGIKCGPGWDGPGYFKPDDDFDYQGNLMHSCFRVYNNPEESFIAHSSFLLDPYKDHRYGFLFKLNPQDYESWAWGLRKSGYATNPNYANMLIKIIKDYALNELDYCSPKSEVLTVSHSDDVYNQSETIGTRKFDDLAEKNRIHISRSEKVVTNNKARLVFALEGDSPETISDRYRVPAKKILKFNEGIIDSDQPLDRGEYVYLEKKKSRLMAGKKTHVVQPGETMYSIAQRYGVQLEKLTVRNRLFPGEEPAVGETIVLKGLIKIKDRPEIRRIPETAKEVLLDPRVLTAEPKINDVKKQPGSYIVETGDTLYGIAKKYEITVELIKKWNNLENDRIKPGQEIKVNP